MENSIKSDIIKKAISEKKKVLTEFEAKEFLKEFDLPITSQLLVDNLDDAKKSAKDIGFPIVMKLMAEDIVHKSDVGAVKLNIKNESELVKAFNELMAIQAKTTKKISIQEMAPEPVTELIIGTLQDPQFGPAIMFGVGGVLVELMKDVSFRISPITEFDANEMIHEIKAFKILDGYRGKPKADLKSLIDILVKISQISMDYLEIDQMDLNPIFIYENGIKIVDARIIMKE